MRLATGRRNWFTVALIALIALGASWALAACGGDDDSEDDTPTAAVSPANVATTAPTATPKPIEGDITVFAASSLTDAFKEAGTKFQEKNPKAKVTFNFAASSALSTQINEGAPADVFASADSAQMKNVTDKGNAADPVIFVTNVPTIVVPKSGSPVATFADLAKRGVRLVLAAPEVPIGRYARDVFTNASKASGGVSTDFSDKALANLKSNEANVRAVLSKVQLGEADAGIVYTTDAGVAANDVKLVEIPASYNIIAQYPIATIKASKNAIVAKAWVDFILSADGQAIMTKWGFGKPPAAASATSSSLSIEGAVDKQTTVTAAQVKSGTQKTVKATDSSNTEKEYTGVALATLLVQAGVKASATQIVFTGSDGFAQTLALTDVTKDTNVVIIVSDDGTLRNIIPSQAPRTWVRQMVKIELK
jgi:molybdate transport system substrate-binding protein